MLMALAAAGTAGCSGNSMTRPGPDAGSAIAPAGRQLSGSPTSYELSLNRNKQFTRRASYSIRESDDLLVSGYYEEDSRAVPSGKVSGGQAVAYLNTRWKSSLGHNLADAQLEFASSSYTPYEGTDFGGQTSTSLFRFDLEHGDRQLGYGLKYYSVGKDYMQPGKSKSNPNADRQGTEVWGRWTFATLGIKPLFTRSYDNIEEEPDRPRLTDTQVGLSLDQSLLSWPSLDYSVSYLSGTRRSSLEPKDYDSYSGPISTAALSVNYSRARWNASLNSSRLNTENTSSSEPGRNVILSHYLSGSYYPNRSISFTGEMGHVRDEYSAYDATTLTNDASVSLNYQPVRGRYDRHLYVSYSAQKNSEWQLDTRNFSAGAGQRWYLYRKPSTISVLSFDVNYDRYLDDIYSDAGTEDLTFWLKFSHTFGTRPMLARTLGYLATPASGRPARKMTVSTSSSQVQVAHAESTRKPVPVVQTYRSPSVTSLETRLKRRRDKAREMSPEPAPVTDWLGTRNARHYTIQLAGSRNEKSAREFIRHHGLGEDAACVCVKRGGSAWYPVLYGAYSSRAAAAEAIKALPASLQRSKPWVRSIGHLQATRRNQPVPGCKSHGMVATTR